MDALKLKPPPLPHPRAFPQDKAKKANQEMMVDLATCELAQKDGAPGRWKTIATVCTAGVFFFGQCNSRPGPWVHLTTDTLAHMAELQRDYWTAIVGHKQVGIRGAHGCYMCPGAIEAANVYMRMEGRDGNHFWLCKDLQLDMRIGMASTVYFPGFSKMNCKDLRDFWASQLHHDEGELAAKIVEANKIMNFAQDRTCTNAHSHIMGKRINQTVGTHQLQ